MSDISLQRCHNHALREAAARCPECGAYYCRECVAEHDDRILCAACIRKLLAGAPAARRRFAWLVSAGRSILGFLLLWVVFYAIGQALLSIPSSVHEGSVWTERGGRP